MPIQQITIVGTGLIGGSFGLALKKRRFSGRIIGCDRDPVLDRAQQCGAIDLGFPDLARATQGSQVVMLATPVLAIEDLIAKLGAAVPEHVLVTDVGSTKVAISERAVQVFGKDAGERFLAGHPMAGKEQSGIEHADADLFRGAVWFFTPLAGQDLERGLFAEFASLVGEAGARVSVMSADDHDRLCAWISHLPQMIATALAAALVEEFGEGSPLIPAGGRALHEMTRISASPYSMWRDIAISNKKNLESALLKMEQRLAHIRENLASRQLMEEFELAHRFRDPGEKS